MRNAAREEYRLAYDREGHVERREHFDGRVYRLAWKNGDLQSSLDPCERLTAYTYDLAGRIVSRKTPEGETTWKYVGRDVAAIANENGVLAYERDETGQVVVENQLGTEIRYERDGMGRRTKQTTPWGETRHAYDANGDWIGLEHGDAQIKVERDAMGREVRRHVGTASEGQIGTFDQAFDPVGRLTGQRYRPGGKEDVAWWRHVQYDAVGNPTRIADSARGTKDYLHNAAGQLVGVLHDGKAGEFYDWDSRGNIVYEAEIDDASGVFAAVAQQMDRMGPVLAKAPRKSTERRFGKGSRISESKQADKTITYLHDAAGCVIEKTVRHADGRVEAYKFEWNTLGQMVSATVPGGGVWKYRYDATGRRAQKNSGPHRATTRWDAAHIVNTETSAESDSPSQRPPVAVFAPGNWAPAISCTFAGKPTFLIVGESNNSVALIGGRRGTGVVSVNRSTWGCDPTEAPERQAFAGQSIDVETGLYYNVFRFYDPDSRRYLSPDPISLGGGINEFKFVDSPATSSDPLGLSPEGSIPCTVNAEASSDNQAGELEVDPGSVNFSQRTVGPQVEAYAQAMSAGTWDWSKSGPLRVMDVDGQLISYDNRRLMAAQQAGLDTVPVVVVDPAATMPGSQKTWLQAFDRRRNDNRNVDAGGAVPPSGLSSQPTVT